jgi:hypothetical protein
VQIGAGREITTSADCGNLASSAPASLSLTGIYSPSIIDCALRSRTCLFKGKRNARRMMHRAMSAGEKIMRTSIILTAILLSLGTIGSAQNVSYDFDRTSDFTRFRTYAWIPGTVLANSINHRRVVAALDAQLAGRGLRQVSLESRPDVLVAYHASFDRDLQIVGFSSGFGPYRFGGSRSGSARAEEILVGTLAVDMVNATTRTIVWRAMASKDIDVNASPEKREKSINKTAEKLFKTYPVKQ